MPELPVKVPNLEKRLHKWEHVRDLCITGYNGQKIELLLGANVLESVLQREVRVGRHGEPIAVRTAFGWALSGSLSLRNNATNHVFSHVKTGSMLDDSVQEWV